MIRDLNATNTTALVTGIALAIAVGFGIALPIAAFLPWPIPDHLLVVIQIKLAATTFNLALLVALTASYLSLYRRLPNKYTFSLLLLNFAMLLYAFTSNPLVHVLFGFFPAPNIGPFLFIPDLFVGLAIVVLFYQSQA